MTKDVEDTQNTGIEDASEKALSDLVAKLWDNANAVMAFAVLQSISLAVALSNKEVNSMLSSPRGIIITLAFAIAAALTHVAAVRWLGRQALRALERRAGRAAHIHAEVWQGATRGRERAIVVFAVLAAGACLLCFLRGPLP